MNIDSRHRIFISAKRLVRWGFSPVCRVSLAVDGDTARVRVNPSGLWHIAQNNTTGRTGSRLVIGRELIDELGWCVGDEVTFEHIGEGEVRISRMP